ncbi:MAG TPA: NFACT RNA binding domain-containing protein [Candidatus Norongarragalinales archaeon]|nr:NFACT RNA binding domain-containing protein [Candidatus Norongarragalinales archaeon]
MKIALDVRKSALENARALFEEAKKFRRKKEGAEKAIEETKRKIATKAGEERQEKGKASFKIKRKWFHEFRFFHTTNGFLCVGGKNAKQNDLLVANNLKENDLFFHADVHGASAVILKEGTKAKEKDLKEAAQFAACYSNAWKLQSGVADVYCVSKSQVSKYSSGEFVGKGAFLISGERKWFKNVELMMTFTGMGDEINLEPAEKITGNKIGVGWGPIIKPGRKTKEELFKELKGTLKIKKTDLFFSLIPGNSELV